MIVVQLAASPFLGGPERQMLGLALSLPRPYRTVFVAFPDHGSSWALLNEARRHGLEALALENDTPRYRASVRELAGHLRRLRADVLCCNGYKPDIIGWLAARKAGIPVVAISHGWTAATPKIRLNEALDRLILRWMDRVVCVSAGQAAKVRRAGVPAERVVVIRNAINPELYPNQDPANREILHKLFPTRPSRIVGAAGRLSPEKGFGQLVEAAALALKQDPALGFVLFGDGPLRARLTAQIVRHGLQDRFMLAGFRGDLARLLPHLDVVVLPSFSEGLPVVVLEAFAAAVPVVASAVGGTPEVIEDGVNGYLVPPGQPAALAQRIRDVLGDENQRRAMGLCGQERVREHFTFAAQSAQYQQLFEDLQHSRSSARQERRRSIMRFALAPSAKR
jgi:glycosyltransferase involved in cell wall biosynthesis